VSANAAAGRGDSPIRMDVIDQTLEAGMEKVSAILEQAIPATC
jgi:hypothetical protein